MGKLITAAALLLLIAAPEALATKSHVRIHIKTSATTTTSDTTTTSSNNAGSLFGQLEDLDPAQFKITTCAPQVWNVTRDKTSALWLDFRSIEVSGGDHMVVSALDGSRAQVLNSTSSGVSTIPIPGKSLKIEFRPSNDTGASASGCAKTKKLPSFTIEKLGVGFPSDHFVTKESVCGSNQLVNAQCLSLLLGKQADAVMRLLIEKDGKGYWCSAWLWGNKGHIITNHHCISTQAHVDKTQFQFQVQTAGCNDKKCSPHSCPVGEILYGKDNVELVRANKALDFAILKITANNGTASKIATKYGYLRIRKAAPKPSEAFFLVQHPHGGPKVVPAIIDAKNTTFIPNLSELYRTSNMANVVISALGYLADTEGGSSGSPLIAEKDRLVIGLHHLGGCPNKAVPSNQLASSFGGQFKDNDGFA
ncbi:hypothetical protein Gpo141_00004584 [Globisporangium polare]